MTNQEFLTLQELYKRVVQLRRTVRQSEEGQEFEKARDELEQLDIYSAFIDGHIERKQEVARNIEDLKEEMIDYIKRISNGFVILNKKQAEGIVNKVLNSKN